jgi:hypothetical protein
VFCSHDPVEYEHVTGRNINVPATAAQGTALEAGLWAS